MFEEIIKAYNEAVFETDRDAACEVVDGALAAGATPEDIVFKVVVPATEAMMARITQDPDANLAQHFMAAQIAADITGRMLAQFRDPPKTVGRVVIGTAYGDLHSLGKRIVSGCLKALMVEVIDLGVNIRAEQFIEAALAREAQVIGISAMMVHTAMGEEGCVKVRRLLREQHLEHKIKIVVGGAPYRFDSELYKVVGADAWAADGISAGKAIIDLIKEVSPP